MLILLHITCTSCCTQHVHLTAQNMDILLHLDISRKQTQFQHPEEKKINRLKQNLRREKLTVTLWVYLHLHSWHSSGGLVKSASGLSDFPEASLAFFSLARAFWNHTWTTRLGRPISWPRNSHSTIVGVLYSWNRCFITLTWWRWELEYAISLLIAKGLYEHTLVFVHASELHS